MAFVPTKQQADAIAVRGTALISAAAGSGKTAVLTSRVVSRMLDCENPVPADRLLVVTFTNAAAAEMRGRIEALLAQALRDDPKNPKIHRQLLLMQNASITTIDAFCIDLVRENFDRLGVSPDFKIATGDTLNAVSERVLHDMLTEEFAEQSPIFLELLEALGSDFGEDKLAAAILKIADYSASMPFPKQWRRSCVRDYTEFDTLCGGKWGSTLFRAAQEDAAGCADMLRLAKDRFADCAELTAAYGGALDGGIDSLTQIETAARAREWDQLRLLAGDFGLARAGRLKTDGDAVLEDGKNLFAAIKKKTEGRMAKLAARLPSSEREQAEILRKSAPLIEKLVGLCDLYEERLYDALLEKNMLSFADAEHLALSLFVREQAGSAAECDGAAELRGRFDEILVDEYQDTNKLQDTLFGALSKGKGNLFMVGDVKQSIYRFRHADPGGFLSKKNTFSTDLNDVSTPSKIILGQNFRSRRGICDFINFSFHSLMNVQTGEMDYGEEDRLVPAAAFPENGSAAVDLALITYDPDARPRMEAEAAYIAEYIRAAVAGERFLLADRKREALRRPEYRDFTILLRSFSGNAGIYAKILRQAGIPVSADAGSLLSAPEVLVFTSLLKVISNPTRDIPLLSALTSPIFGFSYDEVALIRAENKDMSLYAALLQAASAGQAKARAFLDWLRRSREQAAVTPVDQLILTLLEDTGYIHTVLAMDDGERRRRNLLMLADVAAAFSEDGTMTLAEYLIRLERAGRADSLKAPSAGNSEDNAVKIMSIHASKGLQFPVCILANCSGKMNRTDTTESLLVSEDLGIGLKLQDDAARRRISTAAREAISVSAAKAGAAEELRLLYVALTRAEEKLLLCVCEKDYDAKKAMLVTGILPDAQGAPAVMPSAVLSAGSYADWILLAAALHPKCGALFGNEAVLPPESVDFLNPAFCEAPPPPDPRRAEPSRQAAQPELLREIAARFDYRYPYEALNHIAAKTGVSRLVERQAAADYSFTAVPSFLSGTGLTPAQRGTATHKFMQYADFAEARRSVRAEIDRLVALDFFSEEEAGGIYADRVERFFQSGLYRRMEGSAHVMREVRFIDEIPASRFVSGLPDEVKNEPVVVQGVADCIFEENGQLIVLDYKTDRVRKLSDLAARYGEQLRIYAAAAEKNFGKPVKECVIYSFDKNESITVCE